MGKGDRRHSLKTRQRKARLKKKERKLRAVDDKAKSKGR